MACLTFIPGFLNLDFGLNPDSFLGLVRLSCYSMTT